MFVLLLRPAVYLSDEPDLGLGFVIRNKITLSLIFICISFYTFVKASLSMNIWRSSKKQEPEFLISFLVGAGSVSFFLASLIAIIPRDWGLEWPPVEGKAVQVSGAKLNTASTPEFSCEKLLIFIHGWNGDDTTWKKFPDFVEKDNRFRDVDRWIINYPTYFNERQLDLKGLSNWIQKGYKVKELHRCKKVAIIAHSMGGIVARRTIINMELSPDRNNVGRLIEIATPHNGSAYATLASLLGISEELTYDLQPKSKFLEDLQHDWDKMKDTRPSSFCYSSPKDSIVSQESAFFDCDNSWPYPKWGHMELVKPDNPTDDRYAYPTDDLNEYMNGPSPAVSIIDPTKPRQPFNTH